MQMRSVVLALALCACVAVATAQESDVMEMNNSPRFMEMEQPSTSELQNQLGRANAEVARLNVIVKKLQEELVATRKTLGVEERRSKVYATNLRRQQAASKKLTAEVAKMTAANTALVAKTKRLEVIANRVTKAESIAKTVRRNHGRLLRAFKGLQLRNARLRLAVRKLHRLHSKSFRAARVGFARTYRTMRRQYRGALLRMRGAFSRSKKLHNRVLGIRRKAKKNAKKIAAKKPAAKKPAAPAKPASKAAAKAPAKSAAAPVKPAAPKKF